MRRRHGGARPSNGSMGRSSVTPVVAADEQVARFRAEVLPPLVVKYRPTRVLVFGSRARGAALEYSDLDVLIVSSAFTGIRWPERRGRV